MAERKKVFVFGSEPCMIELCAVMLGTLPDPPEVLAYIEPAKAEAALSSKQDLIIIHGSKHLDLIRTAQRLQPTTPVIFLSALVGNLTRLLAEENLKVFGKLRVPFDGREFSEMASRALGISPAKNYLGKARNGDVEAARVLGSSLVRGSWGERDAVEGAKWLGVVAEKGDAEALNLFGVCLALGEGVPQDIPAALDCFKRAESKHSRFAGPKAQFNLGYCLQTGLGCSPDAAMAVGWYEKAAAGGLLAAYLSLGECYAQGEGVGRDQAKALAYYSEVIGCQAEDLAGELELPLIPDRELEAKFNRAVDWLEKVAVLPGAPMTQYLLGRCLADGRHRRRDDAAALRWIRRAAEQKCAPAMNELGVRYHEGRGVVKNDVEACVWLMLAQDHGDNQEGPLLRQLRSDLTEEDKAEVKRRWNTFKLGTT